MTEVPARNQFKGGRFHRFGASRIHVPQTWKSGLWTSAPSAFDVAHDLPVPPPDGFAKATTALWAAPVTNGHHHAILQRHEKIKQRPICINLRGQSGLTSVSYLYYSSDMPKGTGIKPNTSIRIDPDVLHQARIGAVTAKMTLGQWLEEAIREKVEREAKRAKGERRVTQKRG